MVCFSKTVLLNSLNQLCSPNPSRITSSGLGSSSFARHYSRNRFFFLFLWVLRCFSSPRSPHIHYFTHVWIYRLFFLYEFPHSEIPGSKLMCSSPRLIATCYVLHRLLVPRHSPYALSSLTYKKNLKTLWLYTWHKIVFIEYSSLPDSIIRKNYWILFKNIWFLKLLYIFQCAKLAQKNTLIKIFLFNKFSLELVWWIQMGLNHRPHAYQACALTNWAMDPLLNKILLIQASH